MFFEKSFQLDIDPAHQDVYIVRYVNQPQPMQATDFPPHSHNFYEFDYIFDHQVTFEVDNRSIELSAGYLSYAPPMSTHSYYSYTHDTRLSNMVIHFSARLLQKVLPEFTENNVLLADGALEKNGFLDLNVAEHAKLNQIMQELIRLHPEFNLKEAPQNTRPPELTPVEKLRETSLLLLFLAELLQTGNLQVGTASMNTASDSQITHLVRLLIDHPEEKLPMEEAAAMTNMSYSNFCRTFKSTTGYAYVDFCNMQRVTRAKELLKYTSLSVTEISMQLNFGSISYFNRIFKKFTGTSPLAYRTSQR